MSTGAVGHRLSGQVRRRWRATSCARLKSVCARKRKSAGQKPLSGECFIWRAIRSIGSVLSISTEPFEQSRPAQVSASRLCLGHRAPRRATTSGGAAFANAAVLALPGRPRRPHFRFLQPKNSVLSQLQIPSPVCSERRFVQLSAAA